MSGCSFLVRATANAMAEALNGTFKAELVALHGPWRTKAKLEWRSSSGSPGTTPHDFTANRRHPAG